MTLNPQQFGYVVESPTHDVLSHEHYMNDAIRDAQELEEKGEHPGIRRVP